MLKKISAHRLKEMGWHFTFHLLTTMPLSAANSIKNPNPILPAWTFTHRSLTPSCKGSFNALRVWGLP
jgi:hypothetical protein